MNLQKTKLGLFDFTMIVISLVIGMGIFRTPKNVAEVAPNNFLFFLVWIVGGIVALCGALTYAEIGSRLPVTGGYYKIFSYAYHPSIAFAINCVIIVSSAASLAGVALVGSEYITSIFIPNVNNKAWMLIHTNADYVHQVYNIIAIVAIVTFYGLNLLGLRLSAKTQTLLTLIKIVLILLLISPLFFAPTNNEAIFSMGTINPTFKEYLKAFGIGLVAVSFTYGGYQQTINFGNDVQQPSKNLPRGIFLGITLIVLLYLTINYAYIKVIGLQTLGSSTNIAAIMAAKVFGPQAEKILSVFLFLSVLAYVNVLLMSNPRVMYAMAEDKILPSFFAKQHKKNGVLVVSLTVFTLLAILTVFWAKEFDKILSFSIFLDSFGMVLSAATIFILRNRTKHLNGTGIYEMRLYPLLPIVFILAYTFIAVYLLATQPHSSIIGLVVMAIFIGLYFLAKAFNPQKK